MFVSDDVYDPPSPVPSPIASPARVFVRSNDNEVSHRLKSSHGTYASVSTTQGSTDSKLYHLAPEKRPWLLAERLSSSLSGKTNPYNKYPLFIATKLHGLDPSVKNFRAEEEFTSMLKKSIDGTMPTINETKSR